jgi:hypothetical protein
MKEIKRNKEGRNEGNKETTKESNSGWSLTLCNPNYYCELRKSGRN